MRRKFSRLDCGVMVTLILLYVPLSLWGGSERWAGPTDMLPFIMLGIGALYIIFESIRLCSPGLVPVLASVVPIVIFGPSLFLYTKDAEALPTTVMLAYLFGLVTSTICWAIRCCEKAPLSDWSMWLGVHSLFINFLAIPAVILGHITVYGAKSNQKINIRRAIAGLVLGYISLAVLVIGIIAITANS